MATSLVGIELLCQIYLAKAPLANFLYQTIGIGNKTQVCF